MSPDRRNFIKSIGLAAAGIAARSANAIPESASSQEPPEVHLFSKHLQFLGYQDMAAAAKEMGFDGLDLTVRPGGHIEPQNVVVDLPKAVDAIREAGLDFRMMTTRITRPTDPHTKEILETAAKLGCEFYRLGYLKFKDDLSWRQNLDAHRIGLAELEGLNQTLGLHGAYQNHSGSYVGSFISDLPYLFEDFDPSYLGIHYDIRHGTVEGGRAWKLGVKLIRERIRTIAVKDFIWETKDGTLVLKNTPIGEGVVDFGQYLQMLRALQIKPIVSLHAEYDLGEANHGKRSITIPKSEVLSSIAKDLKTFKSLWARHYG